MRFQILVWSIVLSGAFFAGPAAAEAEGAPREVAATGGPLTYLGRSTYDWMAFQDGDRPWRALDAAKVGWRLPVHDPQGRYGLAWVWVGAAAIGLGPVVEEFRSDLASDPVIQLPARPESALPPSEVTTIDLHIANLPPARNVLVASLRPNGYDTFWGLFGGSPGPFTSRGLEVPRGAQEVTILQGALNQTGGGTLVAEKALRLEDFDPAAHLNGLKVDLSRALRVETYEVPIQGPQGDLLMMASGISCAGGDFYGNPTPDRAVARGVRLPSPRGSSMPSPPMPSTTVRRA